MTSSLMADSTNRGAINYRGGRGSRSFPLVCALVLSLSAAIWRTEAASPVLTAQPEEGSAETRLIWTTIPGFRYELQESTDLKDWTAQLGQPLEAETLAIETNIEFGSTGAAYFRVKQLDEQPPEIVQSNPSDESFGVRRFSPITVTLDDLSGLDASSISLILEGHGAFTVASEQLSLDENTLTLDLGGDTPLGGWGATQHVTLIVSDLLGNTITNTWSFELETDAEVAENIFVFGSPRAQRAGQRLRGPTAALAARFNGGAVRISPSAHEWEIESVAENTIDISYTTVDPPVFMVGQLLANLAPANVDQIFYRQITSIVDAPSEKRLTLYTVDATLADLLLDASFALDDSAAVLEFDEQGNLMRTLSFNAALPMPTIGGDFSDQTLFSSGPLSVSLEEGLVAFYPTLKASLDIGWGNVRRFDAQASGRFEMAIVPRILVNSIYSKSLSKKLWQGSHWIWVVVHVVPVGIEFKASLYAKANLGFDASADLMAGFRQDAEMGVSGSYTRGAIPAIRWKRWFDLPPAETVPFTYVLNGQGRASLSFVPQMDVRVYGAAGVYVNADPRLELSGSAAMADGVLTEAEWKLGAYADVNAGLSIVGIDGGTLPGLPPFRLFTREWSDHFVNDPEPDPMPIITRQPFHLMAKIGDTVQFSVDATAPTDLSFQWYHNGQLLPGETNRIIQLQNIRLGHHGSYHVRVMTAGLSVDSLNANLSFVPDGYTGPTSGGMVPIPGGVNSGTDPDFGQYSLLVSGFHMDRFPVTKALWDEVRVWAVEHGYSDLPPGGGKGPNHPVVNITWYDAVKWCNARSEMEGRTPAYYTSSSHSSPTVYRTGSVDIEDEWVLPDVGYRLPTDTEWEYAARGGLIGKRFPWGDTIQHSRANYYSSDQFAYDTSATREYQPAYSQGLYPYTAAVGSLATNGFGLYHMAGNVSEWVYDRQTNVQWVARLGRGASWGDFANWARVGVRLQDVPSESSMYWGFRTVLSSPAAEPILDESMALIPGGTNSGTDPDFGSYSLTVTEFQMDRYPVSKALWDEVRVWATQHGYTDLGAGVGKAPDHPVVNISWYDAVKWCNARSEMEGAMPAYYTSSSLSPATIYRTGSVDVEENWVRLDAGYRLPSNTEWEYAARGGLTGRRFPWGNSIQHAVANYYSDDSFSYDTSSTREYHPEYSNGGYPYTAPVSALATNRFGLYHMVGNVSEWLFDWSLDYVGVLRSGRGASWGDFANWARVGVRLRSEPAEANLYWGFRTVKSVPEM